VVAIHIRISGKGLPHLIPHTAVVPAGIMFEDAYASLVNTAWVQIKVLHRGDDT
jgi:hypothetical protein